MIQNRRLAWPAYLVAFSLSIIPPIDALMQTMPLRIGDTRWRWGVFGLLSNAMMIPMIGLLIAFAVSSLLEHRTLQRVLGGITAALCVFVLAGLAMFALDAVQLHKEVKAPLALAFNVACLTASVKALIGMATLAAFTWMAFTTRKPKEKTVTSSMMMPGTKRARVSAAPRQATPIATVDDVEQM